MFRVTSYALLKWAAVAIALGLTVWRMLGRTKWPIAEGTIVEARLEDVQDGQGFSRTMLTVGYSFEANGTFYGGVRQFGYWGSAPYSYLVGTKVRVRYKPDEPDTSELLSDPFHQTSSSS